MFYRASVTAVLLFSAAGAFGQSTASRCDSDFLLADCISASDDTTSSISPANNFLESSSAENIPAAPMVQPAIIDSAIIDSTASFNSSVNDPTPKSPPEGQAEKFHWGRALRESATFLAIEQAWVVHTDFPWVVSERGIPFNHYWRDYKQSLERWWEVGWSAGENPMYNYVGHPIQGAITEYIFYQNDPKSRYLEFSKSKEYWLSRIKGTIYNGIYSTQWSIGPISEMTVEKYGSNDRPPWTATGGFPCNPKTEQCYWGVGKVNLVMTPVGGLGWVLAEDWMDKNITRRVEQKTRNRFLIDATRCTFNPIRSAANILRGNRPWFRFRDTRVWNPSYHQ
jgi:hypothetical protein